MYKKILLLWMCILTALAGGVNAISIIGYDATTVSHITGLLSKMAVFTSIQSWEFLWETFKVVFAFFIGAIVSGFVTGERAFYLKKRYGFIIIAIGVLIIIPYFLSVKYSILMFAFLMGLQNGMVVSFKGVVVRMTHMSGNLTDLGVFIGYKLKGNNNEKAFTGLIPMAALISFFIGGVIAVASYQAIKNNIFIIYSIVYIIVGCLYFVLRYKCNDKNLNDVPDDLEYEEKTHLE